MAKRPKELPIVSERAVRAAMKVLRDPTRSRKAMLAKGLDAAGKPLTEARKKRLGIP